METNIFRGDLTDNASVVSDDGLGLVLRVRDLHRLLDFENEHLFEQWLVENLARWSRAVILFSKVNQELFRILLSNKC